MLVDRYYHTSPSSFLAVLTTACFSLILCFSDYASASAFDTISRHFGMESVATKQAEFRDLSVGSLVISPDGTKIVTSSGYSEEVHVWLWQTHPPQLGQRLHQSDNGRTQGVGGQTDALRYSPDGKLLASGHGATTGETRILRIWDSTTGAIVYDIDDRFGSVSSVDRSPYEFSPDGRFLIRLDRGGPRTDIPLNMPLDTLIVYDTKTWQRVWTLATPGYSPTGLALNRAGDRAALSGWERRERGGKGYLQYKLVIVDLVGRALRRSFEIPSGNMDVLAWNPNGKRIVVVGNEVVVVDVSTGKVLAEYPSSTLPVGVKYTPDGKRLLIARFDGVEIWDGEHTKLLQKIPGAFVNVMCLSSDGHYMAFAQEAQVGIWKLN